MNKRELQNFAVWAKENLETQIKVSLNLMGISSDEDIKKSYVQGDLTIIDGETRTYPKSFNKERESIVRIIKDEGYNNVVEQFAYTWFNRLIALRFMEVHGYLDHGFKIFPDGGIIEPEILSNLHFIKDDLELDVNHYTRLKNEDNIEQLYRYVLFKQCNSLSKILPMLFSNEYSYLEYLLPPVLLTGETVITKLIELDKQDFLNDIEVIGWLYQFYISVKKDEVFASKKKITKDTLPAVTQLFTPEWIVKYMAENSIGRIWLESYPNSPLKNDLKYYVEEAEQTEEVVKSLEKTRYKNVDPKEIRVIEPAAGSGHILVYSFDILFKMYEEVGYSTTDIPKQILENNLVGLDIDKRATQLAQFALMMKARSIDSRFFNDARRVIPKVLEIKESKKLYRMDYKTHLKELMSSDWKNREYNLTENDLKVIDYVVRTFEDAKVIGSLLKIKPSKAYLAVGNKINQLRRISIGGVFSYEFIEYGLRRISDLLRLAHFISIKYDVMITNPPYQAIGNTEDYMKNYANTYYPNTKTDMFAMFMETEFVKPKGFLAMINQHQWMFAKSYNNYRSEFLKRKSIVNLIHLGPRAFEEISGEKVQSVSFVSRNFSLKDYNASFFRLITYKTPSAKKKAFENRNQKYTTSVNKFTSIPWNPFAYWVSRKTEEAFKHLKISDIGYVGRGLETSNQEKYERLWFEVNHNTISFNSSITKMEEKKWYPFSRGGGYRRWYGNLINVVNWENNGTEMKNDPGINGRKKPLLKNQDKYFRKMVTWSSVGTGYFGARLMKNSIFGNGSALFLEEEEKYISIMAFLNSKVVYNFLEFLSPALTFNAGDLSRIPIINDIFENKEIINLANECIDISKNDWDSKELSMNYRFNYGVEFGKIKEKFEKGINKKIKNHKNIFDNEKKLNLIFLEIYGFIENDEPMNHISENEITIELPSKNDFAKSFISHFIGVLLGRYSIVEEGLIFAGGEFDVSRYGDYEVDNDGIIPLYPKLGMEDNLTEKIIKLIKQAYGEENYNENIDFIAEALGKRQNETSEETLNRYLYDDFYNDHLRTYQKRPIYWMLSSGGDNGFKALIYLHRYTEDTLAMINSDYLLPETTRLRNEINDLENRIKVTDGATQRRLERERDLVNKQYHEAVEYGYVLDHMANRYIKLDLDDGVKVNYEKFQGIEIVNDSGTRIKKDLLVPIK